MGYKAPASVMDGCIHLIQPGKRIFIPRFLKKDWCSNDFWASLYLPNNLYQRAWAATNRRR